MRDLEKNDERVRKRYQGLFSRCNKMIYNLSIYRPDCGLNFEIIYGRNEYDNQLGQWIINSNSRLFKP